MTTYSQLLNNEVTDINAVAVATFGADSFVGDGSASAINQTAFTGVVQNQVVTATHLSDVDGKRLVQVSEFTVGDELVDTSLDFDLADESQFIQESTVSGTDFIDGKVQLHYDTEMLTATYDNTRKNDNITLDETALIATKNNINGWHGVAATCVLSGSDIFYWEKVLTAGSQFHCGAYIEGSDVDWSISGRAASFGWAFYYYYAFQVANINIYESISTPQVQGDVIGIAFQPSTGYIWSHKKGVWLGDKSPATSPTNPYYTITAGQTWRIFDELYWMGNSLTSRYLHSSCQYTPSGVVEVANSMAVHTTSPWYITTSDQNHINLAYISSINSMTITTTEPASTNIKALVSFDGRSTWETCISGSFVTHSGIDTKTGWGVPSDIETGFNNYTITDEATVDFAFLLSSIDSLVTPSIDQITINYTETGTYTVKNISDYSIISYSDTQTNVTKLSAGTSNIKVNILL